MYRIAQIPNGLVREVVRKMYCLLWSDDSSEPHSERGT